MIAKDSKVLTRGSGKLIQNFRKGDSYFSLNGYCIVDKVEQQSCFCLTLNFEHRSIQVSPDQLVLTVMQGIPTWIEAQFITSIMPVVVWDKDRMFPNIEQCQSIMEVLTKSGKPLEYDRLLSVDQAKPCIGYRLISSNSNNCFVDGVVVQS